MNSMINDVINILKSNPDGYLYTDLFRILANLYDFDMDSSLENFEDLYTEINYDNRFVILDKTIYLKEFVSSDITNNSLDLSFSISSIDEYKQKYISALDYEIDNTYLSRKKYRLEEGVCIESKNGSFSYAFDTEESLNFPVDSSIYIYVDEVKLPYFGTIVLCDDSSIIFNTKTSFGDRINHITIAMDSSQLLKDLKTRVMDMNYNSPFIRSLILDGLSNINDDSILKGQDNAVKHACENRLSFIWGPPGTGKTETLANIAIEFLKQGKRVLMVSQSNVSVDGAMKRVLLKLDDSLNSKTILRYGFPHDKKLQNHQEYNSYLHVLNKDASVKEEYDQLIKEIETADKFSQRRKDIATKLNNMKKRFKDKEKELIRNADFIATTITKATVDSSIYTQSFDLVLFDEASMAFVPQVVFAASLSRQSFVCLGDFQQLPAISVSQNSILLTDIFRYVGIKYAVDRKRNHAWLVLLDIQRRMHPQIADFISHTMYYDLLKSSNDMVAKTEMYTSLAPCKNSAFAILDLSGSYSVCTRTFDNSYINLLSAFVCVNLASHYDCPIGIITPYNAQARLIRSMLRGLDLKHVECSTVHQFQGSEKDIIIFDAVDCYIRGFCHDLLTSNRLVNVAISRSKGKFIFIGNMSFLDEKVSKNKKVLYSLLQFTKDFRIKNEENLNYIFNQQIKCISGLANELYESYKSMLRDAEKEVCIDFNGSFASPTVQEEIGKILNCLYRNGVAIRVRFQCENQIPPSFKEFSESDSSVFNTVTIIDRKIVWLGQPLRKVSFVRKKESLPITLDFCFCINSVYVCKSIINFLKIKHAVNKKYERKEFKIGRVCPCCRKPLIQHDSENIGCVNVECLYEERIISTKDGVQDEILSLYAGDCLDIYEEYLIYSMDYTDLKKLCRFITLRDESGHMYTIYKVKYILSANPKFFRNHEKILKDSSYSNYKDYIEERQIKTNKQTIFLFLEAVGPFSKNIQINNNKMKWIER